MGCHDLPSRGSSWPRGWTSVSCTGSALVGALRFCVLRPQKTKNKTTTKTPCPNFSPTLHRDCPGKGPPINFTLTPKISLFSQRSLWSIQEELLQVPSCPPRHLSSLRMPVCHPGRRLPLHTPLSFTVTQHNLASVWTSFGQFRRLRWFPGSPVCVQLRLPDPWTGWHTFNPKFS